MSEQPPLGPDPDRASDPAFESLRNADPTARADATHSDDAVIREQVRSRLAEQAAPQRRRPWLTVAAAAAAAVVLAGGGYFVGAAVTDRPTQTAAESTVVSVEPQSEAAAAPLAAPTVPAAGDVAAQPQPDLASGGGTAAQLNSESADKRMAVWSGRTEFAQEGLSTDAPADGEVSAINPGTVDGSVLAAVGAVVGIPGEVRDTSSGEWQSWSVGAEDGTTATAYLDSTGNLSVNDPTAWQNWSPCVDPGTPEPAIDPPLDQPADPSAAIDIMPVEPCTPSEPLPPLDQAAAEQTIRSILGAAGLDPASFTIAWGDDLGDGQHWATVQPAWAAAGTDQQAWVPGTWNFNWVGNTFSGANGVIADLAPVGSYALISPTDAVARLSDPRFGQPVLVAQPDNGTDPWQPTPPTTFTGGPIPWPVAQMTITSAELRQSALTLSDGVTLLAPTYRLSTADGYAWDVSALADSAYNFAG